MKNNKKNGQWSADALACVVDILSKQVREQADQFGLMLNTINTLHTIVSDLKDRVYELEGEINRKASKDDLPDSYDSFGNSKREWDID